VLSGSNVPLFRITYCLHDHDIIKSVYFRLHKERVNTEDVIIHVSSSKTASYFKTTIREIFRTRYNIVESRLGVEALKSAHWINELFVSLPGIMLKYLYIVFPYS